MVRGPTEILPVLRANKGATGPPEVKKGCYNLAFFELPAIFLLIQYKVSS